LTALSRVLGPRIALGGALLSCACQHDSNVSFDDTNLPSSSAGGSDTSEAGSSATAGETSGGASSTGGKAGGGGATGGKSGGGMPGAGGRGSAGKGGAEMGGSAGETTGGKGGSAGSVAVGGAGAAGLAGSAGTGGTPIDPPEPVTYETTQLDDADVASCFPSGNYAKKLILNPDGNNPTGNGNDFCAIQSLVSIPLEGVPDGAVVSEASLTLTCTDTGGPVSVSFANESWTESEVRWNSRPQAGTIIDTITCEKVGKLSIDLTAAVKAWLAGEHKNYGIYLRTDDTDGTDFSSSEAANPANRPLLSVTYTLPVK
jgi:hypothetical protein